MDRFKRLSSVFLCASLFTTAYACDTKIKSTGACGDSFLDPGEECDHTKLGDQTCATLGYYETSGLLGCHADCTFDTQHCGGRCGDGVIQVMYAEQCEGTELGGATCRSQGYHAGVLSCDDECHFVTNLCTGIGNQRPTFTTTPATEAQEEITFLYSADCADGDGDEVTITVGASDTCGGVLTPAGNTALYSFTPTEQNGGTSCTLNLVCADFETQVQQMQVVNIREVNLEPIIANLPASMDAGWETLAVFDVTAEDPDLPPNSITYEITHSTCSFLPAINTYGRISFTCPATDEECDITVRASDNGQPVMSDTEVLHVRCANLPPEFTSASSVNANESELNEIVISCDDPDGQEMIFSLGSDSCGGTLVPETGSSAIYQLTPGEDRGGTTCSVTFYCSDSWQTDSMEVSISILETNSVPIFDNLPGAVAESWGRDGSFTATAHDPDVPVQTFGYGLSSTTCAFPVSVHPSTGVVNFTCGDPGVCEAMVSVTDSAGGVATQSLQIQCTNQAPIWQALPVHKAIQDQETVINFFCADEDYDLRTFTTTGIHSCGGMITDLGNGYGQLHFTPTAGMGTLCTVSLECGDGHETAEVRATIQIQPWGPWEQISAGSNHTCGVRGGRLFCWGYNTGGQLGDGTNVNKGVPTEVSGAYSDWDTVFTGLSHTCGIRGGHLYCWGSNNAGQLGDNTTVNKLIPTEVHGMYSDWDSAGAGASHTCAIRGGRLYCWGSNVYGQLGDNTTVNKSIPTEVSGALSTWNIVEVGWSHTCGLRDNRLFCWGLNSVGQLGDNTVVDKYIPTEVYGAYSDWSGVSADMYHSCGLRGGRLFCWGYNSAGELGIGHTTQRNYPFQVSGNYTDWTSVTTGNSFTCGLRTGRLFCWGNNTRGQLGDNTSVNKTTPTEVQGAYNDWSQVAAGGQHTCGLRNDVLYCWGYNQYGQLGDQTAVGKLVPTTTAAGIPAFWTYISEYYNTTSGHQCAISNGAGYCWGNNARGQLGTGDAVTQTLPAAVVGGIDTWTVLEASNQFTCGLAAGKIYCWGINNSGQLGDGTTVNRNTPGLVSGGFEDWENLSTGSDFVCAIRQGRRYCWGSNANGKLGNDSLANRDTPTEYDPYSTGWTRLSAGTLHACGVREGRAYCWGRNQMGSLGTGNSSTNEYVPALVMGDFNDWTAVKAASNWSCGVRAGRVYCWGTNSSYQLGNGTNTATSVPVEVLGGYTNWSWVDAYDSVLTTSALRAGRLYLWNTSNRVPTPMLEAYEDWVLRSQTYALRDMTIYTINGVKPSFQYLY